MTSETRTTIEPKDISGVSLECAKCDCRLTRTLDKWKSEPQACPNCGEVWSHFSNDIKELSGLVVALRRFAVERNLPFSIRFDLTQPLRRDSQ
jgi:hypothetical protein